MSRHTHQTGRDNLRRFTSSVPESTTTPPPTLDVFSQDTPYALPASPFDLLPSEGNPQTKEDRPDGSNESEPKRPPASAPTTPPPATPADNFVQQLVQALALLGQAASTMAAPPAAVHPTPTPMTTTRI